MPRSRSSVYRSPRPSGILMLLKSPNARRERKLIVARSCPSAVTRIVPESLRVPHTAFRRKPDASRPSTGCPPISRSTGTPPWSIATHSPTSGRIAVACATSCWLVYHTVVANTAALPVSLTDATTKWLPPTPPRKRYSKAVTTTPAHSAVSTGGCSRACAVAAQAPHSAIIASRIFVSWSKVLFSPRGWLPISTLLPIYCSHAPSSKRRNRLGRGCLNRTSLRIPE